LVFKHLPKLALLYSGIGNSWKPAGELHLPLEEKQRIGLNFHGDDLLISTAMGHVHRRSLHGGAHRVHSMPSSEGRFFNSACVANAEEQLVRLALQSQVQGASRVPQLLI